MNTEPDPKDPSFSIVQVRFVKDFNTELFCIAFDAINCLRSVLDYAVFNATAVIKGEENPDSIKFPLGDTDEAVAAEFKRDAKGVPISLQGALQKLKTFKDGNSQRRDISIAVAEMCIMNAT